MNGFSWTLIFAAAAVGSLHTIAPDHWMPFAALGRARGWNARRTALTTVICGIGHVTVTAALGVLAVFIGLGAIKLVGGRLESMATWLLMGFGTVYMIWGLMRSFRRTHHHDHGLTEWSLFLVFSADPCVAVIPMIFAAAGAGWPAVTATVIAYEIATISTMVILAVTAHAGTRALRAAWVERFGHAVAGAVIVVVGAAMVVLDL